MKQKCNNIVTSISDNAFGLLMDPTHGNANFPTKY